jgi:uncharacterized phage protein gp47/JayE
MAIADLIFVDAAGFRYPDYPTILDALKADYRAIYGADVYLEADSQDGQWIAIQALAIFDTMQVAAAVYNSFSPLTAQGDALSRNVKLNGIRRLVATLSQVDLLIVGQVGATILNGQAEDAIGKKWNFPASVLIPVGGSITVSATAAEIGNITAAANTITKIATPTLGWQTVNNPLAAIAGKPVESDAGLSVRQASSTALPSLSILDGMTGAVAALVGVTRLRSYENDSGVVDASGIPAHGLAVVVEGGDAQLIGEAIAKKKTPGTGTFGTTAIVTYDKYGLPNTINFFRPTQAVIGVEITLNALLGYTTGYSALIAASISSLLNGLAIGDDVLITKLFVPANLPGTAAGATFDITQIRIKKGAGAYGSSNIVLVFNEVAFSNQLVDVTVIVV